MKHVAIIAPIWLALTAAGLYWAQTTHFNPHGYSMEAEIVDEAFQRMMLMGVPVFTFVVVVLVYAVLRFRANGDPTEDGPPIKGNGRVTAAWLTVTSSLAAAVIINPGITGMMELMHPHPYDLTVEARGMRFAWRFRYMSYDFTSSELVLPVNKHVRFEVTSSDVLHSFWIPAFRIKIDAVPGITTLTQATPMHLGDYTHDDQMRVQCAEMCGMAHYMMKAPVRVVDEATFRAWVAEQQANK